MRDRSRPVLGVLLVVGGGYALLQSLVIPALPTLQRDLGASATGVAWIFTGFLLATCVATPFAGRLGDLFGKKRLLVVVLTGLAAGTLLSAVATTLPLMVAGRVIQGFGGAVFPLAFGIIRDELPSRRIASGIALMTAVLGMGGVIGIVLAGPILDHLSYHWLFWLPLVVIGISLVATVIVVPESTVRASGSLSWPAAGLFSAWLVCLLVAVSKAPDWGWGSLRFLGLLPVAGLVAVAWVGVERLARHPFVDLAVLFGHGTWTTNLAAFLLGWGMYSGFVLIPQFTQAPESTGYGFGLSVTRAGLVLLPWSGAMLVSSVVSTRMSAFGSSKRPLVIGSVVCVAGFGLLFLEHAKEWQLLIASGLIGTGVGLAFSALANLVVENVPQTETSVATGVNIIARTIGGVVGTQVGVSVVAATIGASGYPSRNGYLAVFGFSVVALVLATVTAVCVPARARAGAPAAADVVS